MAEVRALRALDAGARITCYRRPARTSGPAHRPHPVRAVRGDEVTCRLARQLQATLTENVMRRMLHATKLLTSVYRS